MYSEDMDIYVYMYREDMDIYTYTGKKTCTGKTNFVSKENRDAPCVTEEKHDLIIHA